MIKFRGSLGSLFLSTPMPWWTYLNRDLCRSLGTLGSKCHTQDPKWTPRTARRWHQKGVKGTVPRRSARTIEALKHRTIESWNYLVISSYHLFFFCIIIIIVITIIVIIIIIIIIKWQLSEGTWCWTLRVYSRIIQFRGNPMFYLLIGVDRSFDCFKLLKLWLQLFCLKQLFPGRE